ncbi:hypothetical protein ACYJ1Y_11125 [Natrialbaceae archaeon A-gly3]
MRTRGCQIPSATGGNHNKTFMNHDRSIRFQVRMVRMDKQRNFRASGATAPCLFTFGGVVFPVGGEDPLITSMVGRGVATVLGLIIIAALGGGLAFVYSSRLSTGENGDDGTSGGGRRNETSSVEQETVDDLHTVEKRVDDATLDRLEPVAPDVVSQVRERKRTLDPRVPEDEIGRMERNLQRGIEEALASGELAVDVYSPYGDRYEIVNLPSQFREVTLPTSGVTVHVADLEDAIEEDLEDPAVSIREVARATETIHEHHQEIKRYIERRTQSFEETRGVVEDNLESIRELTTRLEGQLFERVSELVVEGRHEELQGVREIERQVDQATREFHRCAFEDAERQLEDARRASEESLVAVDFLGGLMGTVRHGGSDVSVPDAVKTALIEDLAPVVERQHGVAIDIENDAITVESRRSGTDTAVSGDPTNGVTSNRNTESTTGVSQAASARPEEVVDEVGFVFRELETVVTDKSGTVEYQTENLPAAAGRSDVLAVLETFCRRQTDVVNRVELQEDAPPGFLTLEFTDRTTPSRGLETLRDRFLDRYRS